MAALLNEWHARLALSFSRKGRISRSTHWDEGQVLLNMELTLDEKPLWLDSGELSATGALRHSDNGLAGFPVVATLWGFGPALAPEQADRLAQHLPWTPTLRAGLTHLPQKNDQALCLVRVLGVHAQDVKRLLIESWMQLRPLILGTPGMWLRLWNT